MLFTWLFTLFFGPFLSTGVQHELVIHVTNIENASGKPLLVGVYTKTDAFPGFNKSTYNKKVITKSAEVTITLKLPPGEYAVALMQDMNENGRIDKNWLGYPTEPFGFSKNFKPVMAPPTFKDCSVDLRKGNQRIDIKLL